MLFSSHLVKVGIFIKKSTICVSQCATVFLLITQFFSSHADGAQLQQSDASCPFTCHIPTTILLWLSCFCPTSILDTDWSGYSGRCMLQSNCPDNRQQGYSWHGCLGLCRTLSGRYLSYFFYSALIIVYFISLSLMYYYSLLVLPDCSNLRYQEIF